MQWKRSVGVKGIFGWNTPSTFAGNIQGETNLHNYFNQYYLLFYRLLVLFPIFVFISIWDGMATVLSGI